MHQRQTPYLPVLLWPLLVAMFLVQMWIRFPSSLNHDAAWFFNAVEQMQQGRHLYSDLIEVNPPLGIWLTWPVVVLAQTMGWTDVATLYGVLFLLTALATLWVYRILRQASGLPVLRQALFVACLAALLLYFPGANFGEREHLLVILFVPWLVLRACAPASMTMPLVERLAIGVLAALAVSIKPQTLLAPIAVELLLLLRTRNWRLTFAAENLAALATVLAYAAAVFVVTPDYLKDMVKLGKIAYYPYYGYPLWVILANIAPAVAGLVIAIAVCVRIGNARERQLVAVTLAAAAGFTAAYLVQAKGFAYQTVPAAVIAFAMLFYVLVSPQWKQGGLFFARLVTLAASVYLIFSGPQRYYPRDHALRAAVQMYAPSAKSVFVATTKVSDPFPTVREMKLEWASTLPAQWFAPYVAVHHFGGSTDANPEITQLARDATVNDLLHWKPDLILVDEATGQLYIPGGKFDYVKFWLEDPRFAALWASYERRGVVGSFAVYTRTKG